MSKSTKPSQVLLNQAIAKSNMMRVSPRKLNLVAEVIRNMKVNEAIIQLSFMKKRISHQVKKCLQSAIANAENNNNLNVDNLYITKAIVGKSAVMKRMHTRARGKSARIKKFFSNLSIIVSEVKE